MKTKLLIINFLLLTLSYSCSSKQEDIQYTAVTEMADLSEPLNEASSMKSSMNYAPAASGEEELSSTDDLKSEIIDNKSAVNKKKIIKDGYISIKAKNIAESKKSIDELVKKLNAYYEREDLQNDEQQISYNLKVRIPADNFEKLISMLENGKDEIKNKSIQARDVTEEYVDIVTRLNNKREYLNRYKQLLSKASTIKDILAIEENIRTIQEEIESKEGRLKYLNDQIAFSSLDISLYKEKDYVYTPQEKDNFFERVKSSLSKGWNALVSFIVWIIKIWPIIILILVIFLARKRIMKRCCKNKNQKE